MNRILALQKLLALSDVEECTEVRNSEYSITCEGNSCVSIGCGSSL
jgi:hypothetical protein